MMHTENTFKFTEVIELKHPFKNVIHVHRVIEMISPNWPLHRGLYQNAKNKRGHKDPRSRRKHKAHNFILLHLCECFEPLSLCGMFYISTQPQSESFLGGVMKGSFNK